MPARNRWPTLQITGYGAVAGALFMTALISFNGWWHMDSGRLLAGVEMVAAAAFSIACYTAVFVGLRNLLVCGRKRRQDSN